MKALLIIDVPDKYNIDDLLINYFISKKEPKGGQAVVKGFNTTKLQPLSQKKKQQVHLVIKDENDSPKEVYNYGKIDGYNECLKEILGEK